MYYRGKSYSRLKNRGYESLETRLCLAVDFDFRDGVLTLTGDDDVNMIKLVQSADLQITATADGVTSTFNDVQSVVVNSGEGNDHIHSSKPKDIVVVGSKIKINAGAGDDHVVLTDANEERRAFLARPVLLNSTIAAEIDLGSGRDSLKVDLRKHDTLELDLVSTDGGETVAIILLVPAVQKIRESAARMNINIDAGGNLLTINTRGMDQVNLSLNRVAPADLTAAPVPRQLTDTIAIRGEHLPGTLGDARAPIAGSYTLNSTLKESPGSVVIHDLWRIATQGFGKNSLSVSGGSGRDTVSVGVNHPDFIWFPRRVSQSLEMNFNLGAGDDLLQVSTEDVAKVDAKLSLGEGNDTAIIRHRAFAIVDRTQMQVFAELGSGADSFLLDTYGYHDIQTSLDSGPTGDGADKILARHLARRPRPVRYLRNSLDEGADSALAIVSKSYKTEQTVTGNQVRQTTIIQEI
ncbi:MAG: hypothetical protein SFX18_14810 [Pirellulales bacterium]|nr:hypothetical protein [Pirellulales bacterium]